MTPTAHAFLKNLGDRGVRLTVTGAGTPQAALRYKAPKGVFTQADKDALRDHRGVLLALLVSQGEQSSKSSENSSSNPPVVKFSTDCSHPEYYPPIPSMGPIRQCRTCPYVGDIDCRICGASHWKATDYSPTGWCCRQCGTPYTPPGEPAPEPPGRVGRYQAPCSACNDHWYWPTESQGWVCATCTVRNLHGDTMPAVVPGNMQGETTTLATVATPATPERQPFWMTAAMEEVVNSGVPVVVDATIGQDWAGTPLSIPTTRQGEG
jgi:hypothetical protein